MRTEDHPAPAGEVAGRHLAQRLTEALAARDASALLGLFCRHVEFRGLTPRRFWEAATAAEVVHDVLLGQWFEPSDVIERVEWAETVPVAENTIRLSYRLRVTNPDGAWVVEQQAYCRLHGGGIAGLRVLCSGFLPAG